MSGLILHDVIVVVAAVTVHAAVRKVVNKSPRTLLTIDVGIKLISLSIVLQIIFGSKVAFLTGDVISSILNIVWTLGNAGLAGLIAAGIIWKLLDKDITNELSK